MADKAARLAAARLDAAADLAASNSSSSVALASSPRLLPALAAAPCMASRHAAEARLWGRPVAWSTITSAASLPPRIAPSIEPRNFCDVQSPAITKLSMGVSCDGRYLLRPGMAAYTERGVFTTANLRSVAALRISGRLASKGEQGVQMIDQMEAAGMPQWLLTPAAQNGILCYLLLIVLLGVVLLPLLVLSFFPSGVGDVDFPRENHISTV